MKNRCCSEQKNERVCVTGGHKPNEVNGCCVPLLKESFETSSFLLFYLHLNIERISIFCSDKNRNLHWIPLDIIPLDIHTVAVLSISELIQTDERVVFCSFNTRNRWSVSQTSKWMWFDEHFKKRQTNILNGDLCHEGVRAMHVAATTRGSGNVRKWEQFLLNEEVREVFP